MASLKKVKRGQTVTEQIDLINENVENVNKELEELTNNDSGFITADDIPVKSVNDKTGNVSLSAKDVGAFPNSSSIQELDINNTKETGLFIGTYENNPYYLIVIKYNNTNVYQELIGLNLKQYRRFTGAWSDWVKEYSTENPVKASDIKGIELVDTDTELSLALLENTTFVKANIRYNPSSQRLYIGSKEFATVEYVDKAVNSIKSIIVNELPETGVENTIYFVPSGSLEGNVFNEFIYINNAWEIVGGTSVDLTPFLTIEQANKTYATIEKLDEKVSKTTTINGKTLYSNITLTAEDVGALPADTEFSTNSVEKYTNEEISTKLNAGEFIENDTFVAIDDGDYLLGHIYKYNGSNIVDITNFVDVKSDQSIEGTKNFTGILRYGGVNVATEDDLKDVEDKIPSVDNALSTTSTNAVQNKVVSEELNKKASQEELDDLRSLVDLKASTSYIDEVAETKVDKVSRTHNYAGILYGVNNKGEQAMFNCATTTGGYTVAYRLANGEIRVGEPTEDEHATTKKYVDTTVANLVNSAPETLDTLGEIATALQENESVVEALNSAIANKANISDLSAVATSGSYEDLTDKPTIPDVSNKLEASNIIAGENISLTKDGNNVTINSTASGGVSEEVVNEKISTATADLAKTSDLGTQCTFSLSGTTLTITTKE